jgi:uncharacterized protein
VLGAWILSHIDATIIRPYVAAYLLLMEIYILFKAARQAVQRAPRNVWPAPLGFVAGILDAGGGGGWGPVATSWLVGAGLSPRQAIGSVNTAEFFVTVAAATTFLIELGASSLQMLVPLVLGGLFAAPLGGWVAKRMPARSLMLAVGALIVALAAWQLARSFKFV